MFSEGVINWNLVAYSVAVLLCLQFLRILEQSRLEKQPLSDEEYFSGIARMRGCSEYDLFFTAAGEWRINNKSRVEKDFKEYLSTSRLPYYVQDFTRKHRRYGIDGR